MAVTAWHPKAPKRAPPVRAAKPIRPKRVAGYTGYTGVSM